jgi:CHASE3 domain sensor protein
MSKNDTEIIQGQDNLESSKRLDAIKNLIFGENIQQINQDFDSIKKMIDAKKAELEQTIEEVQTHLNAALDTMSTDLNIRITDIEKQLREDVYELNQNKVDKSQLGKLLIQLGEKIIKD